MIAWISCRPTISLRIWGTETKGAAANRLLLTGHATVYDAKTNPDLFAKCPDPFAK